MDIQSSESATEVPVVTGEEDNSSNDNDEQRGLKILFLSSDTGGGHRASAESLVNQFQLLYPGSTYDLVDVVAQDGVPPYSSLTSFYKHLSAHPTQWKVVYGVSNTRAFELVADTHLKFTCERAVRRRIKSYNPDVVVSVHPLMNNVPALSCEKISRESGKHLPMFTVVTDLGSAHCMWFEKRVERMFVGSNQVHQLAMTRGKVPEEKLELAGLPIRHDFAVQAEKMGDRMSLEGKGYQLKIREELGLPHVDRKTILLMGGGEGVGSLSNIVNALYFELVSQGIDATVLVVCGRNERLKKSLADRDWDSLLNRFSATREAKHGFRTLDTCSILSSRYSTMRRILSDSSKMGDAVSMPTPDYREEEKKEDEQLSRYDLMREGGCLSMFGNPTSYLTEDPNKSQFQSQCATPGKVDVVGLGFVTNMAEYMVAADVLVTKAGPGTISEAAALSLPVLLTSFLPGQEEGNVDFVIDGKFGAFCSDSDPVGIAEELCMWLTDDEQMKKLSDAAKAKGTPYAARDIARQIGNSALQWREINKQKSQRSMEAAEVSDAESEELVEDVFVGERTAPVRVCS